ncbi:hypothetical protein [Niallia taxi]|nr:hypothetical protein [Niallia taxi]
MPVFVVTGMHYGFAPIILQNMGKYGYDNAILPLNLKIKEALKFPIIKES